MSIAFSKMVASGNDFIVIDNRKKIVRNLKRFVKEACALHTGIGADGILLVEKSKKAKFKMRIINSDGSEAEACGNGFRCIARYAKDKLGYPNKFKFESQSGIINAEVQGKKIRVQLAKPKNLKQRASIQVLGHRLHYGFINTGVPHVVIFVEGLAKIDVESLGRAVREHKKFKPRGTNVNFVEVESARKIRVRTYERGVEAETLACGTGSTASAIMSSLAGFVKPTVQVRTSGGEILLINFKIRNENITDVTLEGEARFIYEGVFVNGK